MPNKDGFGDVIELVFTKRYGAIKDFQEARITRDFLNPLDEWSLSLSDDQYELYQQLLLPGEPIQLKINGRPQLTGYIETVTQSDSGSWSIQGCNSLAPIFNSQVGPGVLFSSGMKVKDVILSLLPSSMSQVDISDVDNQRVIAGLTKEEPDDPDVSAKVIKQIKPKPGESRWSYLERTLNRRALMLHARADGKGVIVSKPDYQLVGMELRRRLAYPLSEGNNILTANKQVSIRTQCAAVILYSAQVSGDGDESKLKCKSAAINELVGTNWDGHLVPELLTLFSTGTYAGASVLNGNPELLKFRKLFADNIPPSIAYVKMDNIQTQEELDNLARRTLASKQREAFVYTATVSGFGQGEKLWSANTCVSVKDDQCDMEQKMYLQKRTFVKSMQGTHTELTLILPHIINLTG